MQNPDRQDSRTHRGTHRTCEGLTLPYLTLRLINFHKICMFQSTTQGVGDSSFQQ
jgi:hypothetical protein